MSKAKAKAKAATLDLAPGALDVPAEGGEDAPPEVSPTALAGAPTGEAPTGEAPKPAARWVNWLTGERREDPPKIARAVEASHWLCDGEPVEAPAALIAAEKAREAYDLRQVAAAKAAAEKARKDLEAAEKARAEENRSKRDRYIARLKTRAGV